LPTEVIATWAPLPVIAATGWTTSEFSTPIVISASSASWPLISSMMVSCASAGAAEHVRRAELHGVLSRVDVTGVGQKNPLILNWGL
jgi:hypothetical protein